MSNPPFAPVRRSRLTWHVPVSSAPEQFKDVQHRLEVLLMAPRGECVYRAKRRALYRIDDEVLGVLAVKEIESAGWLRAIRFRWFATHRGLREFDGVDEYLDRGGKTPVLFAAASVGSWRSLDRFFLFFRWLDEAVDLGVHLDRLEMAPSDEIFECIAQHMVDDARLGLVHGRHATANLLVLPRPDHASGIELQTIDFAYASFEDSFPARGFERDVARLAARMVYSGVTRARAGDFVRIAADKAYDSPDEAGHCQSELERRMDEKLAEIAARPS